MTATDQEQDSQKPAGLVCRQCGCRHFNTYYTRRRDDYIVRVRACRYCGRKLTTFERPAGASER